MEQIKYSVLMPLWHRERFDILEQSLRSMVNQTLPPQEFVFVLDRPISAQMKSFIQSLLSPHMDLCYVEAYHLSGQGLGALLRAGIIQCSCPYVARMDSDDISLPTRCEKELQIFHQFPELAAVGSFLSEFQETPEQIQSVRKVPEQKTEIRRFAKYRNPMNHPTVMLKRSAVLSAGNYKESFSYCEDYELWYRMIKKGYSLYNIQESLLYYRTGSDFLDRRSRKGNIQAYVRLRKIMQEDRFINSFEYMLGTAVQCFFFVSPHGIKKLIYHQLRKQ